MSTNGGRAAAAVGAAVSLAAAAALALSLNRSHKRPEGKKGKGGARHVDPAPSGKGPTAPSDDPAAAADGEISSAVASGQFTLDVVCQEEQAELRALGDDLRALALSDAAAQTDAEPAEAPPCAPTEPEVAIACSTAPTATAETAAPVIDADPIAEVDVAVPISTTTSSGSSSVGAKLSAVGELLEKMHICFERERVRIVELLARADSESTGAKNAAREARKRQLIAKNAEAIAQLTAGLSLRSLIPDAASRKKIVVNTLRLAYDTSADDESHQLSRLKPLHAFLVAKEVINATTEISDAELLQIAGETQLEGLDEEARLGVEAVAVLRLLRRAACGCLDFAAQNARWMVAPDSKGKAAAAVEIPAALATATCTSRAPLPFFTGDVFYHLGSVLEQRAAATGEPQPTVGAAFPELLRFITSLNSSVTSDSDSVLTSYAHCLSCNDGNHRVAWHALASQLSATGEATTSVCGTPMTETDCYIENIRCNGGVSGCRVIETWFSLAMSLRFDAQKRSGEAVPIAAAFAPFRAFLPPHERPGGDSELYVRMDRRDCLVAMLNVDQLAIPQAWNELGAVLGLGFVTVPDNDAARYAAAHNGSTTTVDRYLFQTVDEERAEVGGMRVTKIDALSLAISLMPDDPVPWYRIALALEDEVRCRFNIAERAAERVALRVDPRVYERNVLGPESSEPTRRIDALVHSLSLGKRDPKVWFALGTTLAEREALLARGATGASKVVRLSSSLLVVGGAHGDGAGGSDVVAIGAEECFNQCRAINAAFSAVIDRWRASQ